MLDRFFEFKQAQSVKFKPIKSFYLQDELNDVVWSNFEINEKIREDLLKIANDYLEFLEIDVEIQDIILLGSLANYNWSSYSDFDVHIVFDFSEVNEDVELVQNYLEAKEKIWKFRHEIIVAGFEVELFSQSSQDKIPHVQGIFSLMDNKWIKKPSKADFEPDEELIKKKSRVIMDQIDEVEQDFEENYSYQQLADKCNKIMKKLKDNRQKGLNKEGEFSIENLVFKLLRRNGYIGKLIDMKSKIYDKQFK
jgi:hypothetical protein